MSYHQPLRPGPKLECLEFLYEAGLVPENVVRGIEAAANGEFATYDEFLEACQRACNEGDDGRDDR